MDKEVLEVRNLARHNKKHLINKSVDIKVNDSEYKLYIKGVGAKAIKLEMYLHYDKLLTNHDKEYIESILWDKINRVYTDVKSTTIGTKRIFY